METAREKELAQALTVAANLLAGVLDLHEELMRQTVRSLPAPLQKEGKKVMEVHERGIASGVSVVAACRAILAKGGGS